MKRNLLLLFLSVWAMVSNAQLGDGSIAPNWTATDLNGQTHNFYSILNSGKHAVLDFSATWCGPCWNYHNQGILESLWDDYGPNGTNEIMVYFIEADLGTSTPCLYGASNCVGGTQGNWVNGTGYPIIDCTSSNGGGIPSAYQIAYYPTLYAVSKDKKVYEVGQSSKQKWESYLFQSFNLAVTGTVEPATCPGAGSVILDVTGGYLTKTYSWSNGASTQNLTGVNKGTYGVTVTDANGVSVTKSFVVTGPAVALNVNNQSVSSVTCFGLNNGGVTVQAAGGYPGYSYDWSTGDTGPSISNLEPGTYSLIVTDNIGCTLSESFVIDEPEVLTASLFANAALCNASNGSVSIESEGGTGTHFYQVDNSVITTNNYFNNLAAGPHTYNVTDLNGCSVNGNFNLISTGNPTAQSSAPSTISCSAPTVALSGAGSSTGNNISYLWTTTNGNIVSGANTLNPIVSAAGSYQLVVTNTSLGCSSSSSVNVSAISNGPSSVAGTGGEITCSATQLTLNGSASSSGSNITYAWSTANGAIASGQNTTNPVVSAAGTYTLLVTDTNNNCTATSNVNVTSNTTPPTITVNNGALTCAVNSVQLCATVNTGNVTWTGNGNTSNTTCIAVSAPGSYTATSTAANGCSTSAVATVTASGDFPQISATPPANLTCLVSEITIQGSIVGNVSEYNFSWVTQNGNIVSGANTLTPNVNQPGNYTMTAVNIANGCQSTISVAVNQVINTPIAAYNSTQNNGQLNLVSASTMSGEVSWTYGNGQTASGNSVTISFPTSGTYPVCMTLVNECGSNTVCQDVAYIATLGISGSTTPSKCFGESTGTASAIALGGSAPMTYLWSGPNGYSASTQTVESLAPGTYVCLITDANNNVATQSFDVQAAKEIIGSAVVSNEIGGQSNGSINLTLEGGTGNFDVTWSNNMKGTSISGLPSNSYTASVVDGNGCTKVFGPFVVENVSSVDDPAFVSTITLYPNPTSSIINLNVTTTKAVSGELMITNALGQVVKSIPVDLSNLNFVYDTSPLSSGIYTIKISTIEGTLVRRFIVSR